MPTTAPASVSEANSIQPETFRLPRPGERDPYFGLCRTTYYELDKAGDIHLIRLRRRGYTRGTVLIPFDQVLAHLRPAKTETVQEAGAAQ